MTAVAERQTERRRKEVCPYLRVDGQQWDMDRLVAEYPRMTANDRREYTCHVSLPWGRPRGAEYARDVCCSIWGRVCPWREQAGKAEPALKRPNGSAPSPAGRPKAPRRPRASAIASFLAQPAMSAGAVGRLFGYPAGHRVVSRWIDRGWLAAEPKTAATDRAKYRVLPEAILRFVEDASHWQAWQPVQIADPVLRQYAAKVRSADDRLTAQQVADRLGVAMQSVMGWTNRGLLVPETTQPCLYRSSVVAAFVTPRQRRSGQSGQRRVS